MNTSVHISCFEHVPEMLKLAGEPGKGEKYLPWYAAAGLGAAGHMVGGKLVPKKYKALGSIAGAVAGTAAGVHGGEAVGRALDKKAAVDSSSEELKEPNYNQTLRNIAKRQAIVTAKEIGAVTLPLAAGVGAGKLYEHYKKSRGGAGPGARKILRFAAIPAVGFTAAAMYRGAKNLKDNEFGRIRHEEMALYDQKLKEYRDLQKNKPKPVGQS